MKELEKETGGRNDMEKDAAVIIGLLDEQNCLKKPKAKDKRAKFWDSNTSATERTQTWRSNRLSGQATSVENVTIWDAASDYHLPDSWCSKNNPTETAFDVGFPQSPLCTSWDGVYRSMPFTPPKVTEPVACTDVAPTWIYTVTTSSFTNEKDYFKMSVDSEAGLIWVKALPGGPMTDDIIYTVEIRAESPAGTTTSLNMIISVTACFNTPIVPSVLVDQIYYLSFPVGDYEPEAFVVDASCGQKLIYSNTVTTNTFINDNAGDGKYLSWQTSDISDMASYTVTITATNYCQTGSASYTLDVRPSCEGQLLQIDPDDLKFTSPALTQNVWQPFVTISWDVTNVVAQYPEVDCGPLEFELVTQSDTEPDVTVFTPDSGFDPRLIDVFTEDSLKVGTHPLRIKLKLTDWPGNPGATKDFTVEITDICEVVPYDVTPSAPPADAVYTVGQSALEIAAIAQFTYVPYYCPITYTFEVTPTDPADLTTFLFNDVNLIHTIQTSEIAKVGTYSVETRAVTPLGVDTGIGNTFTVTIIDPCTIATLTIDPTIVPSPYEYMLQSPSDVQSILSSKVVGSETNVTCPPIELSVVKDDLSPIDAAVFTFSSSSSTLTSFSNDQLKVGVYPMKIQAKYSGGAQYPLFHHDFSVNVIDPCLTEATIVPANEQTNPPDYYYTDFSPAADFTLAPFTIDPSFCTQTFSCLTLASSPGQPDICSIPGVSSFDTATGAFQFGTTDIATYPNGVYTIQITSTIGSTSNVVTFDITLVDPCPTATISLNPSPFVDETDDLGAAETTQSWDLASLYTIDTLVDCGSYDLQFYLKDGSQTPLNTEIFEDRRDESNQFARKFVTDYDFVGSYEITYKIFLTDFKTVEKEQTTPFTVTIASSCTTPITLDPSVLVDQEYTLTGPSVPYTFDAFPVDPPICDITYTHSFAEATGTTVVSVFDSDSRTFTFEYDSDLDPLVDRLALFKDYTVTVTGTAGLITSASVSQTFNLRVKNPCPSTIISLNPSPFIDETDDLGAAETTQFWDIATMSTLNTHVDCGNFDLVFYLNDGNQTPLNPSIFDDRRGVPNQFTREFVTDYAFVGSYEITYKIFLTDFKTVETEQTALFTVTINLSCTSPVTFVPSMQTNQEYTLTDLSSDYTFDAFAVDPPICDIVYTFSISDSAGNSVVTFDDVLRTFSFDHTANLDPLIDPLVTFKYFTITVTGTSGEVTPISVDASFNLKVLNPCFNPAFVWIDSVPLPTGEEYILFDFDPVRPYAFSHAPFQVSTAPFSHSYCGGLTYEATFEGAVIDKTTTPMAFDGALNTFYFYSEDYALLGLRSMTVGAHLSNYTPITTLATVFTDILLIDPCIDYLTFYVPPQIQPDDYYYTADSPELILETIQFMTDPPQCAANTTYSCAITDGPRTDLCNIVEANAIGGSTVGAFDPDTGRFTFSSIDMVNFEPGNYTLEVTGTSGSKVETYTVDLFLVDPCYNVDLQLQPSPFIDAIYVLYEPGMKQAWQAENLISPLTPVDCGPITVQFFDGEFTPINTTLFQDDQSTAPSNFFRTLKNTNEMTDGPYQFRYRVYHERYQANVETSPFPFTITIVRSCANPKTLFPTVLVDQEYTITDVLKPYTVPVFIYTPTFCDLVYSFTVVDSYGQFAITFNSDQKVREFKFFNDNDLSVAGPTQTTYTVTVKAILGTEATLEATSSFQLTLKNPCIDPAFVAIDKVPLPAGLEYNLYSFDFSLGFTFQHDPFTVTTYPLLEHSLCGDVHYNVWFERDMITEATRPMKYDTLTRTFDIYSEDLELVGTRTFEVQAFFKDYPVTSFAPNLVETIEIFDPCDKPYSMTDPGQNQSLEYSYTSGDLKFNVKPFVVDPLVCYVSYECISDSCLTKAVRFKNGRFDFETFDMVEFPPGEIEFTIRATVGNLIPLTELTKIKITLVNPCGTIGTSYQNQFPIDDIRYVLGRPQIAQPYDELFKLDTRVDCGAINFEFVYEDGSLIDTALFQSPKTDADERVFKVLEQKATSSVGEYKIKYRATLELYPQADPIVLARPFTVVIEKPPSPSDYVFNVIPDWLNTLEDQYVTQGQSLNYSFGQNTNIFGTETTVNVRMKMAGLFSRYDSVQNAFVVDGKNIIDTSIGIHKINVDVTYVDPKGQTQFFTKSFSLYVEAAPFQVEPVTETEEETKEDQNIVTNFQGFKMLTPQPESKERPIPYIVDLSQTGMMTIGWDRLMKPYDKPQEIPPERIAVEQSLFENLTLVSGKRRLTTEGTSSQKEIPEETWFKEQIEEQQEAEERRMLLLDALQVRMEEDAEVAGQSDTVANFNWNVIDFSKDFIWLQINFENPENLDAFSSEVFITVTFYGVEFFKSFNGIEVEFGTQVKWKIMRQLRAEEARQIDSVKDGLNTMLVTGFAPIFFLIGLGGQLLPTWMFLNSLQLITHVPMIDAHLPATLHYFLVNYLTIIRLDSENIGVQAEADQKEQGIANYKLVEDDQSGYSTLLNMCGYKQSMSRNLFIFTIFAMVLLFVTVGLLTWQCVKSRQCKTSGLRSQKRPAQYGAWTLNFSLRLVYEFFLEICICVAINVATLKLQSSESGLLLWTITVIIGLFILALIGFVTSLLVKGGPYTVPKSFEKNSLTSSFWGKRALCSDNCAYLCTEKADILMQSEGIEKEGACKIEQQQSLKDDDDTERLLVAQSPVIIEEYSMLEKIPLKKESNDSHNEISVQKEISQLSLSSMRENESDDSDEHAVETPHFEQTKPQMLLIQEVPNVPAEKTNEAYQYEGGSQVKSLNLQFLGQENSIQSPDQLQAYVRIKDEARLRNSLADSVEPRLAYKTLFYGLKKNQPHNMAVIHPLAFLLRRVLYAVVILFFVGQAAFFGAFLLLATCLVMMIFVLHEAQWDSQLINAQHLVNESFFYLFCISMILFNGVTTVTAQVQTLSWLMIICTISMIIFNVLVILFDLVSYILLLFRRHRLSLVRGMAKLKAFQPRKSAKTQCITESSRCKKALAESSYTEDKVKENQVIDEEIVIRNSVKFSNEAVSPMLSSSLALKRDLQEGSNEGSIHGSKYSSKVASEEFEQDIARSDQSAIIDKYRAPYYSEVRRPKRGRNNFDCNVSTIDDQPSNKETEAYFKAFHTEPSCELKEKCDMGSTTKVLASNQESLEVSRHSQAPRQQTTIHEQGRLREETKKSNYSVTPRRLSIQTSFPLNDERFNVARNFKALLNQTHDQKPAQAVQATHHQTQRRQVHENDNHVSKQQRRNIMLTPKNLCSHNTTLFSHFFNIGLDKGKRDRAVDSSCHSINCSHVLRQQTLDSAPSALAEVDAQKRAFMGHHQNHGSSYIPSRISGARSSSNFVRSQRVFSPVESEKLQYVDRNTSSPVNFATRKKLCITSPSPRGHYSKKSIYAYQHTHPGSVKRSRTGLRSMSSDSSLIMAGLGVFNKIDEEIDSRELRLSQVD